MSVTVIYEFQAADGKESELLNLLQQARVFGPTVDGCEAYDVYQGKDDSGRFVMIETWASVAARQDHFERNVQGTGVSTTPSLSWPSLRYSPTRITSALNDLPHNVAEVRRRVPRGHHARPDDVRTVGRARRPPADLRVTPIRPEPHTQGA